MSRAKLTALAVVVLAVVAAPALAMATDAPRAQEQGQSVEVEQVSVEQLTLRNVTATDVVVRELTVRRMGDRENVTMENVSAQRVTVRRATLTAVQLRDVVVRDRRLVSALGFGYAQGGNVTNESRASVLIRNRTLDGVVVDSLTVESVRGLNVSGTPSETAVDVANADLVVGNATVDAARSVRLLVGNRSDAP